MPIGSVRTGTEVERLDTGGCRDDFGVAYKRPAANELANGRDALAKFTFESRTSGGGGGCG